MKAVHLHIDRVVVDGLPAAGQRQFARSLEERLRAWAAGGAADGLATGADVRIGALDAGLLRPDATTAQAAGQVVRSIARGVSGNGASRGDRNSGGEARGHV